MTTPVSQEGSFSLSQIYPREMRLHLGISAFGFSLNLGVTFFLISQFGIPYLLAYLVGTLANVAAATLLRVLGLRRLMRSLNIRYGKLLLTYLFLALVNMGLVFFSVEVLRWHYAAAIVFFTLVASALNFILVGLWAFVCFPIQEVVYEELDGEFFDMMVDEKKVGKFRAWVHQSRFKMTRDFVKSYYSPGHVIIDFAAGSCGWNTEGLPVRGVDVNEKMLEYGLRKGRLKDYRAGDIYQSPFPDEAADLVVSSQVFEHLNHPEKALREIRRVLKPGGVFVIDVPYDLFLGPHFLLFNVHCFIEGYFKGKELYRQRCGHLNHFTKKSLTALLQSQGFTVERTRFCNFLTIHMSARKHG